MRRSFPQHKVTKSQLYFVKAPSRHSIFVSNSVNLVRRIIMFNLPCYCTLCLFSKRMSKFPLAFVVFEVVLMKVSCVPPKKKKEKKFTTDSYYKSYQEALPFPVVVAPSLAGGVREGGDGCGGGGGNVIVSKASEKEYISQRK